MAAWSLLRMSLGWCDSRLVTGALIGVIGSAAAVYFTRLAESKKDLAERRHRGDQVLPFAWPAGDVFGDGRVRFVHFFRRREGQR